MNKDLLNQLPADEQTVASKLDSLAGDMKLSPTLQWELENHLLDAAKKKTQPAQGWFTKFMMPIGWVVVAVCAVVLLNLAIRSLVPGQPAPGSTSAQELSFEASVRNGNICAGPLALSHGFSIFLTNPEKTQFVAVNVGDENSELRSFSWSTDGNQLAIVSNEMGSGSIYITDPDGRQLKHLLSKGELGYTMDVTWSRDGQRLVIWSSQNNRVLYLMNADGTGLVEKQLNVQIMGAPQFWPDDSSVVFYGVTPTAQGLFELLMDDIEVALINSSIEGASTYAFSPDGSHLAYVEYDRDTGEARLISEDLIAHELTVLGTLPIPKVSGSSLPEAANLSWAPDGKSLVFDFGRGDAKHGIYLAHADGTGLTRLADSAYAAWAPTISADGRCLAYISDKQVFLLDLSSASSHPTIMLLADLPPARGIANSRQDELHWKP